MADISDLIKASGIDARRTATELFGKAVEDFAAAPLNDALKAAFPNQTGNAPINRNDGSWYATSYAHSLANSQYRPKLKFLFRVEFLFDEGISQQFGTAQVEEWQRHFVFLIKSVDRPKVDFEYEEINQYNFRTKVLKQIKHRELTMTFMDDVGNYVYEFFRFMMMVHSPITRRSLTASQNIHEANAIYSTGSGMEFTNEFGVTNDFAHRGVVNTTVGNVIKAIKVTQFWVNPMERIDIATHQVSFFFINPRVVSFDLDDVNHESSDPNLFTMQFDYDFMVMSKLDPLELLDASKTVAPVGTAPGDAAGTGRNAGLTDPNGGGALYTKILSGVAGRAVQRVTNETIGRAIRTVPGLGSVAGTLTGIAEGITRDRINSMSAPNQSFARPTRDVVVDNTTAGRDNGQYTTSGNGFGPDQPSVSQEE